MIPAVVLAIVAGGVGWRRAARLGGSKADRWQYAFAHGIPAFLAVMIAMTVANEMGWLQTGSTPD